MSLIMSIRDIELFVNSEDSDMRTSSEARRYEERSTPVNEDDPQRYLVSGFLPLENLCPYGLAERHEELRIWVIFTVSVLLHVYRNLTQCIAILQTTDMVLPIVSPVIAFVLHALFRIVITTLSAKEEAWVNVQTAFSIGCKEQVI